MKRSILLLGALALLATTGHAEDAPPGAPPAAAVPAAKPAPPPTPEQAADAVLAAVAAKDDAALKALASKDDPDPWLVADELIRRGQLDGAEVFATAAPRVDTEKLPAYVTSRRGKPDDSARRERLVASNAALQARKPADALEATGPEERGPIADVVGVRLAMGRGIALAALVRLEASAAAFHAAGEAAEKCGWLARASHAFGESGTSAFRGSALVAARGAWERWLSICERRADTYGAAAALGNLGLVYMRFGKYAQALSCHERELVARKTLGDGAGAARALSDIGTVHHARSDFAKAIASFESALAAYEALGDDAGAAVTLGNLGVCQAVVDYAKSLTTSERALAAMEALGDKAGAARTLGNLGNLHSALRNNAMALSCYQRALEAQKGLGDQAGVARSLVGIGTVQAALGETTKALATLERALATHEALRDKGGAATTLASIGGVHRSKGDHARARAALERALAEQEALGDKWGAARTLGSLGAVYGLLGEYGRALSCYERAVAAMDVMGDKAGATSTLVGLGNIHYLTGAYEKALSIYERARVAQEALGDHAGAASTLTTIGSVHRERGDYAKALANCERALAAQEALGDEAGAAKTLVGLGSVHFARGDYARAFTTYERALAAQEALGDKAGAVTALGNIGVVHAALGDYAKALSIHERTLAAQEALGDKAAASTALGNMGLAYRALGNSETALVILERALVAKEALGDEAGAAWTRDMLGGVYRSLGDFSKSLATYERTLAAQEALGDRAGAAATLGKIGGVHHALGDSEKAIKFLERAVRTAEKLGASRLFAVGLLDLARVRLALGDAGRAIESAHKAVSLLKTLVGGLGEEQGATARAQYTGLFSTGLAAAAQVDDAAEAAFFLESGRAGTMLESLDARDTLRHAALPEPLRIAEAQARAVESRAQAAYVKAQDGDDLAVIRAAHAALEAARATTAEVYERIQREAKREARLWYPVATPVEDIQGFLAPEEALVLYGLAEGDDPAYALVLTRGEARIVALGASSAIVAACEALEANDASVDSTAAFERLRMLLIAPLGLAKATKRLLISPEGPLSYVPFAALVPDLEVAYEPSGTTYGVLLEEKDKRGTQVLALGDPDYTAKFDPTALDVYAPLALATPGATRGGRLAALPGTRAEATAIGGVTLLGKDASERGLRAALANHKDRWRGVHFACHGLVNPDRPTLSSLALTPDGDHDGFLTVLEVLRTEIPADLVVLSACETGKGKIVGGEGIVGLTRAFMYAGAPRVICSLWKVDDAATSALMTKFYELWNPRAGSAGAGTLSEPGSAPGESKGPNVGRPGLPTAEALRQAQGFVRSHENWKHPYYWAAWVLWGLPE